MSEGDFASNEKSVTVESATSVKIEHTAADGAVTVFKEGISLQAGEIIDSTCMSKAALVTFLAEQKAAAKNEGVLFSLHMKATMMKISDPIFLVTLLKFISRISSKNTPRFSGDLESILKTVLEISSRKSRIYQLTKKPPLKPILRQPSLQGLISLWSIPTEVSLIFMCPAT